MALLLFSADERFLATKGTNGIGMFAHFLSLSGRFELPSMQMVPRSCFGVPNIREFAWSPAGSLLAYTIPETTGKPATVVVLDVARGRVEHGGRSVDLTRNELKILHMLMANHDTIISRQELMVELWQSDAFIDDNTLTVNINRLRKSLASIGVPDDFLVTRRGQGYVV